MALSKLYDLTTVREYVGDDEEQLLGIIIMFLEEVPLMLDELKKANEVNDTDQIYFYAHKLKSSVDLFRINTIQDEIRSLEKNAREKVNISRIPDQIANISEVLKNTILQVKEDFPI